MPDTPLPQEFHAHIYFDEDQASEAEQLCLKLSQQYELKMGRVHKISVGPHPRGSCQITVPFDKLAQTLAWLSVNRGGFTVFAHALTGNDLTDHTQGVIWLGESEKLKLDMFRKN